MGTRLFVIIQACWLWKRFTSKILSIEHLICINNIATFDIFLKFLGSIFVTRQEKWQMKCLLSNLIPFSDLWQRFRPFSCYVSLLSFRDIGENIFMNAVYHESLQNVSDFQNIDKDDSIVIFACLPGYKVTAYNCSRNFKCGHFVYTNKMVQNSKLCSGTIFFLFSMPKLCQKSLVPNL